MKKQLFLDCNSHLPMSPKATSAFIEFIDSFGGHGHPQSPSAAGRAASNAIETARAKIANLLGAKSPNQIVFTSTCTQACEWSGQLLRNLSDNVYMSPTEHPAMKQAIISVFKNVNEIPIDENGVISEIEDLTSAGVCIHIQNEIGVIQPIDKLKFKYLLVDMSQSVGKTQIDFNTLTNVDIATFGAHKFGGPASVGFIYLKDTSYWKEFGTGSRYFMDRPGTPDGAAIVATAEALEDAIHTMPKRIAKMKEFRDILEPGLKDMGLKIVAEKAERSPSTAFVYMGNGKGIVTLFNLGDRGIIVGLGSACGSSYTGTSPLMAKLGVVGGPNDFIRISNYGYYGAHEAKHFLDVLKKII